MAVIYDFIYDLIYEHEIFANALFIKNAAVVSEYFHHSIYDVKNRGRSDICFGSRNKVYAKLLSEKVVDSIDVLNFFKCES